VQLVHFADRESWDTESAMLLTAQAETNDAPDAVGSDDMIDTHAPVVHLDHRPDRPSHTGLLRRCAPAPIRPHSAVISSRQRSIFEWFTRRRAVASR
jgi:hypothetical protein